MSSSKSENESRSESESSINFEAVILPLKDAIGLPRPLKIQSISSLSKSYPSLSSSLPSLPSSHRSLSSSSSSESHSSSILAHSSHRSLSGSGSSENCPSVSTSFSSAHGLNSEKPDVDNLEARERNWKDLNQDSFKSVQPSISDKDSDLSDWSLPESRRDQKKSPKKKRSKYVSEENPDLKKITHCYPEHTHISCNERPDKFCILVSIFFLFIISWIIIQFWNRFFISLYFRTFCFDENSTYDIFVAAVSITLILIIIVYFAYSVGDRALCRFVGADPEKKDYECRICPVTRNY